MEIDLPHASRGLGKMQSPTSVYCLAHYSACAKCCMQGSLSLNNNGRRSEATATKSPLRIHFMAMKTCDWAERYILQDWKCVL